MSARKKWQGGDALHPIYAFQEGSFVKTNSLLRHIP